MQIIHATSDFLLTLIKKDLSLVTRDIVIDLLLGSFMTKKWAQVILTN